MDRLKNVGISTNVVCHHFIFGFGWFYLTEMFSGRFSAGNSPIAALSHTWPQQNLYLIHVTYMHHHQIICCLLLAVLNMLSGTLKTWLIWYVLAAYCCCTLNSLCYLKCLWRWCVLLSVNQPWDPFARMCHERRYPYVRLDRTTTMNKRQKSVNLLNDPLWVAKPVLLVFEFVASISKRARFEISR